MNLDKIKPFFDAHNFGDKFSFAAEYQKIVRPRLERLAEADGELYILPLKRVPEMTLDADQFPPVVTFSWDDGAGIWTLPVQILYSDEALDKAVEENRRLFETREYENYLASPEIHTNNYNCTTQAENLARKFHDTYEELAPSFGYETRKDTKQFDPESPNGRLMIAVCAKLLERNNNLPAEIEKRLTTVYSNDIIEMVKSEWFKL